MKKVMIAVLLVVAASATGCFRASVDTDYNADASKLLTGHPKIPATAALIISQEQRDRDDSATKLGFKVTVKTGDSLVGINKAAVSQMFESMVEGDSVGARTDADLILEPKVNEVITQVHGIGIVVHVTSIGKFQMTAYDKDAKQIWSKETTAKFESPNMFGLKALFNRNQVAKDAYDSFLPGWKEIYDDFYNSQAVTSYLSGMGKAP
jgi:hypothetical protein